MRLVALGQYAYQFAVLGMDGYGLAGLGYLFEQLIYSSVVKGRYDVLVCRVIVVYQGMRLRIKGIAPEKFYRAGASFPHPRQRIDIYRSKRQPPERIVYICFRLQIFLLGPQRFRINDRRIRVRHIEHRRDTADSSRPRAIGKILFLRRARIAEMAMCIDAARQDIQSLDIACHSCRLLCIRQRDDFPILYTDIRAYDLIRKYDIAIL